MTQAVFVVGWVVGGALERGYSPAHMYVSELGRRGAAHPWIFDVSVVVWGAGFVALGLAVRPGLRSRPWGWAPPSLFVAAGLLAILEAPLRLDCAASADRACAAAQGAGALSWHHYAHNWIAVAIVLALLLTPFALARSEWPSRLAVLTLTGGVWATFLWAASWLGQTNQGHYVGLWQRLGLLVIHGWVLTCAAAVLREASYGWPPTQSAVTGDALGRPAT